MKVAIIGFFALLLVGCSSSKEGVDSKQVVEILTNAECGTCKSIIEKELNYVKGIVFAELNVPTKIVTVKFYPSKISLDEIKAQIAEIGYNADDVKANPAAQSKLPKCCQPGGMND